MKKSSNGKAGGFRIAIKTRLYHGALFDAMTRLHMNRKQTVKYLGTSYATLNRILCLKGTPNFITKKGKNLKRKLEELTEMSVSELFPDHIVFGEFASQDKTIEVTREVPPHLLGNAGMIYQLSKTPDEELIRKEEPALIAEALEPILRSLTERQRLLIRLRYFEGRTLAQCIKSFNVGCGEAVRRIQKETLKSLRHPTRSRKLQEFS